MNKTTTITFPTTYQESVDQFQEQLAIIQRLWPAASLRSKPILESEDLRIYWIEAQARRSPDRLLIISSGLHGVEGYVGAAMRSLFIQEYLDCLDPETTGLLLVHNLNPWGMKHHRRVNASNVDLNRNFMEDPREFQEDFNPSYKLFDGTLNPRRRLGPAWSGTAGLLFSVLVNLVRFGIKGLRGAVLLGQGSNPRGLYFSGCEYQPETSLMMDLIKEAFQRYREVTEIDMHTGYGPRWQMSIVNSPSEERSPQELRETFGYPLIVQADPDQFYSMKGDMIDWIYRYRKAAHPQTSLYAAAFEFGVYGDGIPNEIKSLRTMIFENQNFWNGASTDRMADWIENELLEMYFPPEGDWREKALADCRQALAGVLLDRALIPE